MPKRKKKAPRKPASMLWEFDPDIPTHDFFENRCLDDIWNQQEAVDSFVHSLEEGRFLAWEAVACEEHGVPLTAMQKKALGGLVNFNDDEDDQILYIDEIPRPNEPWHVILNKIAPHLPEKDRPIFLKMMQEKLGLASSQEQIVDCLYPAKNKEPLHAKARIHRNSTSQRCPTTHRSRLGRIVRGPR